MICCGDFPARKFIPAQPWPRICQRVQVVLDRPRPRPDAWPRRARPFRYNGCCRSEGRAGEAVPQNDLSALRGPTGNYVFALMAAVNEIDVPENPPAPRPPALSPSGSGCPRTPCRHAPGGLQHFFSRGAFVDQGNFWRFSGTQSMIPGLHQPQDVLAFKPLVRTDGRDPRHRAAPQIREKCSPAR